VEVTFSERIAICDDNDYIRELARKGVKRYSKRLLKAINRTPIEDMPFMLFAMETIAEGIRCQDAQGAKTADELRSMLKVEACHGR
jgi:hypothetical protein